MSADAPSSRRPSSRRPSSRWEFQLSWIGFAIAIISAVASIIAFIYTEKQDKPSLLIRETMSAQEQIKRLIDHQAIVQQEVKREADSARKEVERIQIELQKSQEEIARLSVQLVVPQQSAASAELVQQLTTMRTSVEQVASRLDNVDRQSGIIDGRMSKLEAVILADPQKVLELPLLKKDVQAFQQQFDRDLNALKAENARVYELMKWLIGLMALVSLSLVGTAIGNMFKREPARNEET